MKHFLPFAVAAGVALSAPAWAANDYSGFDCTSDKFIDAFTDAMNGSDEFKSHGQKVLSISDAETIEATKEQLTCRGVFEFASGEKVDETFVLKDGPDGHLTWSYKPTK